MEGYEIVNDKGERAWWDGKQVVPLPLSNLGGEQGIQGAKARIAQEEKRQADEFTRLRQQSAIQEPAFQSLQRATIPTLATAASFAIPGSGLLATGAQAALGGGATALNQALGLEAEDAGQVALGAALPVIGKAIPSVTKAITKETAKFTNPAAFRKAGGEAAMENLGATRNTITRAFEVPASKVAYEAAEAAPPLTVKTLVDALRDVMQKSGKSIPNKPALKQISGTIENLQPKVNVPEIDPATNMLQYLANKDKAAKKLLADFMARPTEVKYREVINEVQGLRAQADMAYRKGNSVAGTSLNRAASALLDKMDEISPTIKEANALYKREKSIEKIAKVLEAPRPDTKLRELFANDELVRQAIGHDGAKMLEQIAEQLTTVGSTASPYSGVGARALNLITRPIAAAAARPEGQYLLRKSFKDGRLSPAGFATVAQFMRAYEAQEAARQ